MVVATIAVLVVVVTVVVVLLLVVVVAILLVVVAVAPVVVAVVVILVVVVVTVSLVVAAVVAVVVTLVPHFLSSFGMQPGQFLLITFLGFKVQTLKHRREIIRGRFLSHPTPWSAVILPRMGN
jgi:hypothetical protein